MTDTRSDITPADRLARVRAYVDDPGNWSVLDGRRRVLLDLIDGKEGDNDDHND